jgi:hypothetical protein
MIQGQKHPKNILLLLVVSNTRVSSKRSSVMDISYLVMLHGRLVIDQVIRSGSRKNVFISRPEKCDLPRQMWIKLHTFFFISRSRSVVLIVIQMSDTYLLW